jgi:hypothetical protein
MATPTATTPAPATPEEAKATMGDAEATRNQLAAFEAGALKSPNPNATRRFKLEFELDQMQATDDAFFDFWVECVHLAVANMQATRLQYLQLRVEKLENPDTPPLGAMLLSMAASLLEQLVVVGVIELAAGTAIAVGGWFAYQCAASRIASGLKVAQIAAADAEILSLNAAKESLERNAEFLQNVQTSTLLGPASADKLTLQLPGNQEIQFSPRDRQSIIQAWNELEQALQETNNALSAQQFAKTTFDAEKIATAINSDPAAANIVTWAPDAWEGFVKFLGDEFGGAVINPAQQLYERVVKALTDPEQGGQTSASLPSSLAGQYFDAISAQRRQTREAYARLRLHVRYQDDAAMTTANPLVTMLMQYTNQIGQLGRRVQDALPIVRESYVRSIEAGLWTAFLKANRLLEADKTEVSLDYLQDANTVSGAYFIEKLEKTSETEESEQLGGLVHPRPTTTKHYTYSVTFFPGSPALSDDEARGLYDRFARPYFVKDPKRALPFKFDVKTYDAFDALPRVDFFGNPNPDRVKQLNEIRYLVIRFFLKFVGQKAVSTAVDDVLQWVGPVGAPAAPGATPAPANGGATPKNGGATPDPALVDLQQRLETTPGIRAQWREIARAQYESLVARYRIDLVNHSLLSSGAPDLIGLPAGTTTDDLAREMEARKADLKTRYDALTSLSADDPGAAQDVANRYAEEFTFLSNLDPALDRPQAAGFDANWKLPATEAPNT